MKYAVAPMRRALVVIIVTCAFGVLSVPLPTNAQQAGKVYRIGFLGWSSKPRFEDSGLLKAFWEGLREYGWVEGQNIVVEYRFAGRKAERLPALAAELARLKLDLIVTVNTTVTRAAMRVIKTTPIVFTLVADPVSSGFVTSLGRPGGNATGPSGMGPQLASKRLELLKEVVPALSRVAVIWEPTNPGVKLNFQQTQRDAPKLGLVLHSLEVRSRADFTPVFAAITRAPPDALVLINAPLTVTHDELISAFALEHRLPTIAGWGSFPAAGGLMYYGENYLDKLRRAAPYVDKILRGAKPGALPVQQPTRFELVINLKTAEALGLTIPPTLRLLADDVIR